MNSRHVIIVGLGKSGIAALHYLNELGISLQIFDQGEDPGAKLKMQYEKAVFHFGQNPTGNEEADLVVISPGIDLDQEFVRNFKNRGIEIIGDIELAFREKPAYYIGITGTNGKTTTTTLVGEIFKAFYDSVFVVGNIGDPILDHVPDFTPDSRIISELSSYQLESTYTYRPRIAAILNVTEDHLLRHKTMENYTAMKFKVAANQNKEDYLVLNYDDSILRDHPLNYPSKIIFFSRIQPIPGGVYVEGNGIFSEIHGDKVHIMDKEEIQILGEHNVENVLACVAVAVAGGIEPETIRRVIADFQGVEHRLEPVRTVQGVDYINDSKATNPDASIKALEALKGPIVLIAGGLDKKSDYSEFIKAFGNKVKHLVLIGETKDDIEKAANDAGFYQITKTSGMSQAVQLSSQLAVTGDTVLLSPACASWDMYPSFEIRGKDFKDNVMKI